MLQTLVITIQISKILRIPLAMLYYKFPQVTRSYFILELVINAQEAFMVSSEPKMHSTIIYTYLMINYFILGT